MTGPDSPATTPPATASSTSTPSASTPPGADAFSDVWIVMPAYNAEATIVSTFEDIPELLRSRVIVVDDCSSDNTVAVARDLGVDVIEHPRNRGYGGNQKTCYQAALDRGAGTVVMLHPDYQYDARVVQILAEIIDLGICDVVLGNRIRTRREALDGGMPRWKYFTNRATTFAENLVLGQSIGDFHSGMRAYSREVLEAIPFEANSDDFAFDQEFLVQAVAFGFRIGDIPVPVRYMDEASSIGFKRSVRYGVGGLGAIGSYYMAKSGIRRDPRFEGAGNGPVSGS
jgi:glycosyltransferase involved in cell wall biosynthesis